ncbi:PHP domain-containing protein [Pectinatus frisingensis]|uniref:PHP domain-containing protein n=1 Tax=Pectinatus frisingensis TaxID=865 RepID=UPI0018C6D246|nr:PHP domain-containing protein [Pectinatus frisingensis]
MGKWLDLHMHSVYSSDGEFLPETLMQMCSSAGLRAVALADHNSTKGTCEAQKAAIKLGLLYFPAIEIDCTHEKHDFHLLGYGICYDEKIFKEIEQNVYEQELERSGKILNIISELGFHFDKKLVAKSPNGVITAETIAEEVLKDLRNKDNELLLPFRRGGVRSDNPLVNFYWDFCAQGKPAYVPMHYISLGAAVNEIQKNGGAAVLAHPGANMGKNYEITKSIIETNIDGIEVYNNYHDAETTEFYEKICHEYKLIATAGSDFHGKTKPSVKLGGVEHPAAYAAYEQLMGKIRKRGGETVGCL